MLRLSQALALLLGLVLCTCARAPEKEADRSGPPNVVLLYMDDMGYGDLSSFGHPNIRTPNLDRLAREGQKWTSFYTASSVCSPSRGALLTGRYPIRIGLAGPKYRVFFPKSKGGLPTHEITIAEMLKEAGYATACVGKWHLGHLPQYLPTRQGFDYYYGIPYSNDMDGVKWGLEYLLGPMDTSLWKVPVLENETEIQRPADQFTITKQYTEKAVAFIEEHREEPFFLYLPHSMVHTPLFASPEFQGTSPRGRFGDAMAEVDWSVGQITATLEELGLAENTLVVFSSDNGPWLSMNEHGGSAGLLKDGKGTTWEGGMRVPGIFYQPGSVQPGIISDMGSTLDLLPTIAAWTGASPPTDRILDGYDLSAVLRERAPSPRDHMLFYRKEELFAARLGDHKAHFITATCYRPDNNRQEHPTPLLYHLEHDPSEVFDKATERPEVLASIREMVDRHRRTVVRVPAEMEKY
ncbi:MAG: sulfatase [Bacteroidota bacterium]